MSTKDESNLVYRASGKAGSNLSRRFLQCFSIPRSQLFIEQDAKDTTHGNGTWRRGDRNILFSSRALHFSLSARQQATLPDLFAENAAVILYLDHVNLLSFYGLCLEATPPLFLFECTPLGTLASYINQSDSSVIVALSMGSQVCAGMAFLSHNNILHLSLSVRTCYVSEGLVVKISDLGLIRILEKLAGPMSALDLRISAPEGPMEGNFSLASDVWSFGVLLWELVSDCRDIPYANLQVL